MPRGYGLALLLSTYKGLGDEGTTPDFCPPSHQTRTTAISEICAMREEYDFAASVPNTYAKKLNKQVTIRLEEDVVDYFKALAEETDIPYQTLINLYLKDCMKAQRKPSLEWVN
jgi:uncharacterized protein (DUF4415 family)